MTSTIPAKPGPVTFDLSKTALIVIDMQKDFLEEGGFGQSLGNDVSKLQRAVAPCKAVLEACRNQGDVLIIRKFHMRHHSTGNDCLIDSFTH
jgi:nicotinamidase-related amidase